MLVSLWLAGWLAVHRCSGLAGNTSCVPWLGGEKTYDAVESRALVTLGLVVYLVLARAELAEVLGGTRHDILEQLERDPAEGLSCVEGTASATD